VPSLVEMTRFSYMQYSTAQKKKLHENSGLNTDINVVYYSTY